MTCSEYQEFFSDFFDGDLDAARRADVEAHIAACPDCRREYDVFAKSIQTLTTTASIEAPERLVESVTTTLRIQRVTPPPESAPAATSTPRSSRTVPPARSAPSWAPVGAAAAVIVAFVIGYFVPLGGLREELKRRDEELARLRKEALANPPAEILDNVVIVNRLQIPIDRFLAQEFEMAGLVKDGPTWVSRTVKERLDRGEALVEGRWIDVRAEIKRRVDEAVAAQPKQAPGVTEEQVLEKLGLAKRGSWYVPREWAQALDAGMTLTATGEWKRPEDIVAQIMAEHRLVQHDGRWMSEEQRQSILAQQFVRQPETTPLEPAVTRALAGLEIGPPWGHNGKLTLYPLMRAEDVGASVVTLHEALGDGQVDLVDKAGALAVRVKNEGKRDLFLLGGAFLAGGNFGRVVARDALVPAGKTVDVRVYDAEPTGPLRTAEKFGPESGHYIATGAMRRALAADGGQGYVWNAVASQLPGIKGTTPVHIYRAYTASLVEYRASLIELRDIYPRAVGVVVAIGEHIEYADVFASPALFRAYYERILMAAILEAVMRRGEAAATNIPNNPAAVKHFLESAFGCESEPVEDGFVIRTSSGRPMGRALARDAAALHVVLFAESNAPAPVASLEINPVKVQKVLEDYEKRLDTAPAARKPAIVREIAALPQQRVMPLLIRRLDDNDPVVRRTAIEALGRRGDPAAVKPLLKTFKESNRELTTFQAAATALAGLGHEEAVKPMLDVLHGRDYEAARIVADALPRLLLQIRNDSVLVESVSKMIDALEKVNEAVPRLPNPQVAPEVPYQGALTTALRATTGKDFANAVEFRLWWNEPANKKKFLDERRK